MLVVQVLPQWISAGSLLLLSHRRCHQALLNLQSKLSVIPSERAVAVSGDFAARMGIWSRSSVPSRAAPPDGRRDGVTETGHLVTIWA
jgi:hypothetical protein